MEAFPDPAGFAGKVAFVTGAASGIGAATALKLANLGARLVLADRDKERLAVAAAEFEKQNVLALEIDVTSLANVEQAIARGVGHFGGIDLAVNSAGIDLTRCETGQYPADQWDRIISVNLTGVFNALRHQIPAMLRCSSAAAAQLSMLLQLWVFVPLPASPPTRRPNMA